MRLNAGKGRAGNKRIGKRRSRNRRAGSSCARWVGAGFSSLIIAITAPSAVWSANNGAAPDQLRRGAAVTNLKLPRFVSLGAAEVNARSGPGVRYPVDWVYRRKGLPVEVIAEFDAWRKIRDWQGTEGWVHKSLLSGRRTAIVITKTGTLRRRARPDSPVIAKAEEQVIARLLECKGTWCRIDVAGYRGWLRRESFWGAYPGETID